MSCQALGADKQHIALRFLTCKPARSRLYPLSKKRGERHIPRNSGKLRLMMQSQDARMLLARIAAALASTRSLQAQGSIRFNKLVSEVGVGRYRERERERERVRERERERQEKERERSCHSQGS